MSNKDSNLDIQAYILILQTFLIDTVTPTQEQLFQKYCEVKTNQLEKQNKNKFIVKLPKIKWLNDIQTVSFRLPTDSEIQDLCERFEHPKPDFNELKKRCNEIYIKFKKSKYFAY